MDEVRAAMAGGGAPAAVGRANTEETYNRISGILSDKPKFQGLVSQLFSGYAGADRRLQPHEMQGLAQVLSAQIGIDGSLFENINEMFHRFDYDGGGHLDLAETQELIKFLLKEQKRTLKPREEHHLTHLERKNLKALFDLGKKIGQGGQGAVYLANDKTTGAKRVVKFYEKAGGNSCLEDIKDEFELLKRLDHPNVARICEAFEDHANIYVVSEPYTGGDLCTIMEKAQKNRIQVTHQWLGLIFLQAIEGIKYLHSKHTMHCDLKEPNCMIADDEHWQRPHVMLIDFGMAKSFDGNRMGGTPGYMPPEFWQYNLWTPKGDMFAMAVMFWSIYNGQQGGPFVCPDAPPFQRLAQRTCTMPMDCSKFPPGFREVVQGMAEKDFKRRPSAAQVHASAYFQQLSNAEESQPLDQKMVDNMIKASQRSDAQNLVAMKIAEGQNLGQMKEMNELFRQLDADDDGTVESVEALQVLQRCGVDSGTAQSLVDSIIGSDGKIHYSEFMARMISSTQAMTSNSLAAVFREIDADGSGSLSRNELEKLMGQKNMESLMGGRSAGDLLAEMDVNGDGVVSFEEFRQAMVGGTGAAKKPAGGAFNKGDAVQYSSPSAGSWLDCKVIETHPSGAIQIDIKPGQWLRKDAIDARIRKTKGGGGYA